MLQCGIVLVVFSLALSGAASASASGYFTDLSGLNSYAGGTPFSVNGSGQVTGLAGPFRPPTRPMTRSSIPAEQCTTSRPRLPLTPEPRTSAPASTTAGKSSASESTPALVPMGTPSAPRF